MFESLHPLVIAMPLISDLTAHLTRFALTHPSYSDQINELWRVLDVRKNPGVLVEAQDTSYTGDGPAVSGFVRWFRTVVQNQKAGPKTDDRGRAFDVLEQDILGNQRPGAFTKIDRFKFAFQLALRIREPKLIDQTNTNLCGPNALVIQMARDRPSQYATLAAQLFLNGRGFLDKLEIEPNILILHGVDEDALGECDYVVLGSIRNSAAILLGDNIVRTIGLLTKPGVLCDWLRRAGYKNVEDHTFFDVPLYAQPIAGLTSGETHGPRPTGFTVPSNRKEKRANLRLMATKLAMQHKVIMNAETALSDGLVKNTLTNSGLTGRSDAMVTHWTFVKTMILSNTHVSEIKLYTWGGSFKRQNIPIDDFVSRYAGFVSYQD
jgi:hypothetical protein